MSFPGIFRGVEAACGVLTLLPAHGKGILRWSLDTVSDHRVPPIR